MQKLLIDLVGQLSLLTPTAFPQEFLPYAEEYQALHNGVKKVLGMIVGLLKDRACVDKSPSNKRIRIEGYRSKK